MWKYEPSRDFVARVMGGIHAYEATRVAPLGFFDGAFGSRIATFAMSWCSVLMGMCFTPAVCL
jgi:hypothetical protein